MRWAVRRYGLPLDLRRGSMISVVDVYTEKFRGSYLYRLSMFDMKVE